MKVHTSYTGSVRDIINFILNSNVLDVNEWHEYVTFIQIYMKDHNSLLNRIIKLAWNDLTLCDSHNLFIVF
jgi:hypothetical protein